MRKISVLILALLVLVIFPTWALAGEIILKEKIPGTVVIIFNKKTHEVTVFDGDKAIKYQKECKLAFPIITQPGEIRLIGFECSPWHWCVLYGNIVKCP